MGWSWTLKSLPFLGEGYGMGVYLTVCRSERLRREGREREGGEGEKRGERGEQRESRRGRGGEAVSKVSLVFSFQNSTARMLRYPESDHAVLLDKTPGQGSSQHRPGGGGVALAQVSLPQPATLLRFRMGASGRGPGRSHTSCHRPLGCLARGVPGGQCRHGPHAAPTPYPDPALHGRELSRALDPGRPWAGTHPLRSLPTWAPGPGGGTQRLGPHTPPRGPGPCRPPAPPRASEASGHFLPRHPSCGTPWALLDRSGDRNTGW